MLQTINSSQYRMSLVTCSLYCVTRNARRMPRKQGDSGFNMLQNLGYRSLGPRQPPDATLQRSEYDFKNRGERLL